MKRLLSTTLALQLLLVLLMCGSAFGATYYVTFSGSGNEDGSTYANSMAKTEFEAGDLGELDDDTVYLCDAWSNYVTLPDGGTSGHTATYRGDEGTYPYSFTDTSGDYAMVVTDIDYVDLRGFTIAGPTTDSGVMFGIVASGTSDHTHIDDCTVSGFDFVAITFYGHDGYGSVTNCTISDCGNGIYIQNQDIAGGDYYLFADNTISDMNYSEQYNPVGTNRDGHAVGIQSASYCIVRNNEFYNTGSAAVSIGGGYQSKDAEYNAVFDNLIRDAQNTYAQSSAGQGLNIFNGVAADDTNYIIVYRNRFDTLNTGVKLLHDNLWNAVFHNTFYKCGWPNVTYSGTVILDGTDAVHATNYKILNNLISSTSESRKIIYHLDDDVSATNTYDYNHYNPDYLAFSYQGAAGEAFDPTWQARGYDANSISVDDTSAPAGAGLTDPANDDFTIPSNSACMDAGTTFTTVTQATEAGGATVFTVADPYYFHDGYGLTDIDGTVEDGQTIGLYDSTNGYQEATITDVNYGTSTITVSANKLWVQNVTTVALAYNGVAPDIGYYETTPSEAGPSGDNEDLSTYTIVHPGVDPFTILGDKLSWVDLRSRDSDTYVYKDFTADYFDGDFTHTFECEFSNAEPGAVWNLFWGLANELDDNNSWAGDGVIVNQNTPTTSLDLQILENGSAVGTDVWTSAVAGTTYYMTVSRDDDGGANNTGQYTLEIHEGDYHPNGTHKDLLTADCSAGEQNDFQYLYVVNTLNTATADRDIDGFVENLNLGGGGRTFITLFHSDSSGTIIAGATTYTSGYFYLTLQGSDGEFLSVTDEPMSDLVPTLALSYGTALEGEVFSGLDGTSDLIVFRYDVDDVDGARIVTGIMGESALPHGTTKIVNSSVVEMSSYNYPDTTAITGGVITIASPLILTVTSVNTPGTYDHWVPGDDLTFITTTDEAINTAVSGTSPLIIGLHIKTPIMTALTDNWTIDEDWWDIEGHRRIYNGTMTVDGSNNTVTGFSAASTGTGPTGFSTWMPYPFFLED